MLVHLGVCLACTSSWSFWHFHKMLLGLIYLNHHVEVKNIFHFQKDCKPFSFLWEMPYHYFDTLFLFFHVEICWPNFTNKFFNFFTDFVHYSKLLIVLNFAKLYVVLHFSSFNFLLFFSDAFYWLSEGSKDFNASTCFSPFFSIVQLFFNDFLSCK